MKNYDVSAVSEDVQAVICRAAELIETIFYGNDVKGLESMIRSFDFLIRHARMCKSCLEFIGDGENPYKKIQLLLGYLGHEGISEDFVSELEELADEAHEYLETDEDEEKTRVAEARALENVRMLLDKAEMQAATYED
ncbi:MAG: hypothetical protein IJQ77_06910 [Synergistaceae bacterium]|nr:hypothetical protein [Synergistaceae bacterium]MBQ3695079.1 hypothetical protein [Synergistaceae bacterium]MBR0250796.1 hypothetical protein [Synergistaceae bacterium]